MDRKHILLVDDEEAVLLPLARYLRAYGFLVDTATNAFEAEALAELGPHGLVILDLSLAPDGQPDGLDLVRYLRARDPGRAILVVTAHATPELHEEARRCGADAVLTKPQPLSRLAELARAWTGAGPAPSLQSRPSAR